MATNQDDPWSVFGGAFRSVVGLFLVVFATALVGMWLGHSFSQGKLAPVDEAFGALIMSTFAWLIYPKVAIAIAVTVVALVFPLRIESTRLRLVAAAANLLAWFGIAAWVMN